MHRLNSVVAVFCAVLTVATADYRNDTLSLHNQYRKKHSSSPLALSNEVFILLDCTVALLQHPRERRNHISFNGKELNTVAQNWANNMVNLKQTVHSNNPKYGENLYWSSNTKLSDSAAVIEAMTMWYNEVSKYSFILGTFSSATGHITQLVWKNSKYLGIGIARSSQGVYVCANVLGQFITNVLKALI